MRALLACAVLSATAQAATYRFGASQDRVVSDEPRGYTQHVAPDFEVQDGIAVTYVRLGRARVARLVSTGYAAKVYTDVAPLDGADGKITAGDAWISQQAGAGAVSLPVAPTAVERLLLSGARRILYESVPTTAYFAHDHLGSLTVETDDHGAVIGRRDYTPFGQAASSTGDTDRYGFTGQEHAATGLVHFKFRDLDPVAGRWTSPDPLFETSTAGNLVKLGEATTAYAYVANNPENRIDPTGLQGFWARLASCMLGSGESDEEEEAAPRERENRRAFLTQTLDGPEEVRNNAEELASLGRQLMEHSRNLARPEVNGTRWTQRAETLLKKTFALQEGLHTDLELLNQSDKTVNFPTKTEDLGHLGPLEKTRLTYMTGAAAWKQAVSIRPGLESQETRDTRSDEQRRGKEAQQTERAHVAKK